MAPVTRGTCVKVAHSVDDAHVHCVSRVSQDMHPSSRGPVQQGGVWQAQREMQRRDEAAEKARLEEVAAVIYISCIACIS